MANTGVECAKGNAKWREYRTKYKEQLYGTRRTEPGKAEKLNDHLPILVVDSEIEVIEFTLRGLFNWKLKTARYKLGKAPPFRSPYTATSDQRQVPKDQ